jgi:hypothetical protein
MATLTSIMPFFIVEDLKNSTSFYIDKLGFEMRYIGPDEDPYWAIVGRDDISIMLKAIAPGINAIPNQHGTNGRPGMRIFLLLILILYLKNIVQRMYRFTNLFITIQITYGALK